MLVFVAFVAWPLMGVKPENDMKGNSATFCGISEVKLDEKPSDEQIKPGAYRFVRERLLRDAVAHIQHRVRAQHVNLIESQPLVDAVFMVSFGNIVLAEILRLQLVPIIVVKT